MIKRPILLVYAGPNGSGKTTVTRKARTLGVYVNADDIKKKYALSDLEAAERAETLRNELLDVRLFRIISERVLVRKIIA